MKKLILTVLGVALLQCGALAQFQTHPRKVQSFNSASPIVVNANVTTNLPASLLTTFPLSGADELSYYIEHVSAGASTSDLHFVFEVTADGTVWYTDPGLTLTFTRAKTGATVYRDQTNHWQSGVLRNFNAIRLVTITNGASAVTITNAVFLQR